MHAYVVVAHQLPEQLARMIDRVATAEDHVFLHLDAKVDAASFFAGAADLADRPNVTLLPRVRVRWGDFSLVEALLSGVRAAVGSGAPFSHVSHLSGQDYPIRPVAELQGFLDERPETVFMSHYRIPTGRPGDELGRVDRRFYHVRGIRFVSFPNRYIPIPRRRRFPLGFTPYKGSALWTMPMEAARAILAFLDAHPDYVEFFRRVLNPDEYFFQSVLVNALPDVPMVDDDLRFTDWSAGGHHPKTLATADLPRLAESRCFLARKFDVRVDARLLDAIDEQLLVVS